MRNNGYHHIPPCGGLHSLFSEQYCFDCQGLTFRKEMLRLKRREIELQEMALEIEPREPRKRYVPYVQPSAPDQKPPIKRRGL